MSEKVGFGANKVIIAVPPCEQPAAVEWGVNLAGMRWPLNTVAEYSSQDGEGEDPVVLRNYVAGYALATKARYIWFLNNDVLPPSWTTTRLIESMRADPSIMVCAGMSLTNVPESTDFSEVTATFTDGQSQWELLNISPGHSVNLECTIVRAEVFDKIEEPWFKEENGLSSEAFFCKKVMDAGYKVVAHSGVLCGSVDMTTGKIEWPVEAIIDPEELILTK